jgi:hypothetical protein
MRLSAMAVWCQANARNRSARKARSASLRVSVIADWQAGWLVAALMRTGRFAGCSFKSIERHRRIVRPRPSAHPQSALTAAIACRPATGSACICIRCCGRCALPQARSIAADMHGSCGRLTECLWGA